MRKIEQQMLQAINERRDWRCDNTEVQVVSFPHNGANIDRIYVRLHGSTIAIITPDEVDISDCGWTTPTTKSRLNVLLHNYCKAGIQQKSRKWYLLCPGKEEEHMNTNRRYVLARA
jgi:hypothetical protein